MSDPNGRRFWPRSWRTAQESDGAAETGEELGSDPPRGAGVSEEEHRDDVVGADSDTGHPTKDRLHDDNIRLLIARKAAAEASWRARKPVQINIRVTPELRHRIGLAAARDGRTLAQLLQEAFELYEERHGRVE